jgi:hypothetical protein
LVASLAVETLDVEGLEAFVDEAGEFQPQIVPRL